MEFSLHTQALCWLRYGRRLPLVCTEAGGWYADVIGMDGKVCVEVEIKKSRADLLAEFRDKREKHYVYANAHEFPAGTTGGYCPNYFYFFVPKEIGESTAEFVTERAPKAGVAVLNRPARTKGGAIHSDVSVLRKATKLHDRVPSAMFVRSAQMRMGSELALQRITIEALKSPDTSEILREIGLGARLASGTLDFEDPQGHLTHVATNLAKAVEGLRWGDLDEAQRGRWLTAATKFVQGDLE